MSSAEAEMRSGIISFQLIEAHDAEISLREREMSQLKKEKAMAQAIIEVQQKDLIRTKAASLRLNQELSFFEKRSLETFLSSVPSE